MRKSFTRSQNRSSKVLCLSNKILQASAFVVLLAASMQMRVWGFAHQWKVNEIYSNADGSVQFLEMTNDTAASGETLLATRVISCTGPSGTHQFVFPSNLVGNTAFKTFLVATPGFASLPGGITPNYVFTNAVPFLFPDAGSITFSASGATVTYTNLPADGTGSMVRSGGTALILSSVNTPRNFAGQAGSIVPVQFTSSVKDGDNIVVSFPTANGFNYTVQTNGAVDSTNWNTLTSVSGDGTTKSVTNSVADSPQGFFRLRAP